MALPLKDMTAFDFSGVVFSRFPPDMTESQARTKIEMWIVDSVEQDISRYRKEYIDGRSLSQKQMDDWEKFILDIRESRCVISPQTINMFFTRRIMDSVAEMNPWDREAMLLDEYPGRFYPRYKINLTNPNAKQFDDDDIFVVHKDGRVEYKGKAEKNVDDLEFSHNLEMEMLESRADCIFSDEPMEKDYERTTIHHDVMFFGDALNGL